MKTKLSPLPHTFALMVLAAWFCWSIEAAQAVDFPEGVSAVWQAPAKAPAGGNVSVRLLALNSNASGRRVEFPPSLVARLAGGGGVPCEVTLQLDLTSGGSVTNVTGGGFAQRTYIFRVNEKMAGPVTLDLTHAGGGLLALVVEPITKKAPGMAGEEPKPAPRRSLSERAAEHPLFFDAVSFFKRHVSPHEPLYFIAGTDTPNAKFQVSLKYRILANDDDTSDRWWENFHVGYTQTSLWDWNKPSAPFFDSSYKPELLYSARRLLRNDWFQLDLSGGLQHESNGKDGNSSRSLNIAYLRPKLLFFPDDDFQFFLQPRVFTYVGDLTDNPDLDFYRGHLDLRAVAGWPKYAQVSALLRAGDNFKRGSAQLDLTVPLWFIHSPLAFQVQYFTGYGESLLQYNQRSSSLRMGFSLYP